MRYLLTFFVMMCLYLPVKGQIQQPQRLELPLEYDEDAYYVAPAEEKGLMLFREPERKYDEGFTIWEFVSVDTALNIRWTKEYKIDYDYLLNGYAHSGDFMYVLFRMGTGSKDNYNVIKMNLSTGDTTHHILNRLMPVELSEFEVINGAILLGGHVNYRPVVLYYDINNNKSKVLQGVYRNDSELIEMELDQKLGTFNVLVSARTPDRLYTITLLTYNASGDLLQSVKLQPREDTSLIFGHSTGFRDGKRYIAGTYSHKRSSYSRGIYIAHVDTRGKENIQYYSYADLKNFFDYMKAGRQARVKKRIERKKIKGKKARFNYRLLVHDIIETDGQFVLIGEAFYPRYNNSLFYGGFLDFGRDDYNNANLIGYNYTHAIVIGFDKQGKLLWDNSFEINDVLSYELKQFVHASVEKNYIALFYIYENEIRSKIIMGDKVQEGKSSDKLKLKFEDDAVKNTDLRGGGLERWYGKYFYVHGIQKILSQQDTVGEGTREVYFINKIVYP